MTRSTRLHAFTTRGALLKTLSDEEVDAVYTAETNTLDDGDEYVDLKRVYAGVQLSSRSRLDMGHVLPKKALQKPTWNKILAELPAPLMLAGDSE